MLFLVIGMSVGTTGLAQEVGHDDSSSKFRTFSKFKDGAYVYFSSHRTGGKSPIFESIDSEANANVVHRMLYDRDASGVHFGYDIWVERIEGSNKFRVTIKPLSQEYKHNMRRDSRVHFPEHIASPDPHFPDPLTVEDGDTLTIDVLVNHTTGEKIGDVIKISSKPLNVRPRVKASRPARDFTIADFELKVLGSKIMVNGELEGGNGAGGGCAGSIIWFYLPNRGRFIVSLVPRPGYDFQKIATIEDNKILFSIGGDRYEWLSTSPIVGDGGSWNLWVLHDPDYQPSDIFRTEENPTPERRAEIMAHFELKTEEELEQFLKRKRHVIGAADAVEYILKKSRD
jgi:hypothetical protein